MCNSIDVVNLGNYQFQQLGVYFSLGFVEATNDGNIILLPVGGSESSYNKDIASSLPLSFVQSSIFL